MGATLQDAHTPVQATCHHLIQRGVGMQEGLGDAHRVSPPGCEWCRAMLSDKSQRHYVFALCTSFYMCCYSQSIKAFFNFIKEPGAVHVWKESLGVVQFSSVIQSCLTLPLHGCSTPGFPVHHQLPEFPQTHVHWVGNAIQPSHQYIL